MSENHDFFIVTPNINLPSVQRLLQVAQSKKIVVKTITPKEINALSLKEGHTSTFIMRNTGIDFDDSDLLALKKLKALNSNVTTLNHPDLLLSLRDKEKQFSFLKSHGFSLIPWMSLLSYSQTSHDSTKKVIFPYPLVIKTIRGNQGLGQWKCETEDEVDLLIKQFQRQNDFRYLVQPFLPAEKELRILTLDKEILGVIEKDQGLLSHWQRNSQYSNFKKSDFTLPLQIRNTLQKFLSRYPGQFLAFDYLESKKGTFHLLEINGVPGFIKAETALKIDMADKIWGHLLSRTPVIK